MLNDTASRVTEYQRIVSFRNFLIHQYSPVDDELVWNFFRAKLPTLNLEVGDLLQGEWTNYSNNFIPTTLTLLPLSKEGAVPPPWPSSHLCPVR